MNILLLGSKSFIGKHIYHQLKDKLNINSLDNYFEENDILRLDNTEFCEKYFSKLSFKIDIIINLVHIHKKSFKEELNINTKLVDKICYFVEQKKIRIIHISSVNCSSDNCDNKYSYTKSSLENRIIKTNNFTILRLSTVISKNKNNEFIGGRNGNSLNLLNFFIKKIRFFPLIRNGSFIHTICFLEDIDELIKILINQKIFLNEIINFYSGQYITFKELIMLFAKSYNKSIYFVNIPDFVIKVFIKVNNILNLKFITEQKLKNLLEQNIEYDKSNELAKYIKLTKIN